MFIFLCFLLLLYRKSGAKQMFIVIAIYSRNVDRVPTTGQVMKETCNKQVNISMSRVVRAMKKTEAEEGDSV